jgi:hypothetical protein
MELPRSLQTFMEGTQMVATIFGRVDQTESPIKVLDLLTNRYHVGIVREYSDNALQVTLPASAHLCAGQRVRFIVGDHALVARHAMQRGFITQVTCIDGVHYEIRLALIPETAVA